VAAYRYEAVDGEGRPRRGLIDADTPRQVRERLRADGLFPTEIDAAKTRSDDPRERLRLPPALVALATRQLATLAHSGMPLDQALVAVAEQVGDARAAQLFTALRDAVTAGEPLASAMSRWPRTFDNLYRGLVGVGAETGRLAEILERLADYLEAREALKQKITLALIYPVLVTVIALGVISVLLIYVVPQVVSVYEQSRQTLPWLTQGAHRGQRVFSRHLVDVCRRAGSRPARVLARQSPPCVPCALARGDAALSGDGPAADGGRHRALCQHAGDSRRQRRAAAALARRGARRDLGAAAAHAAAAAATPGARGSSRSPRLEASSACSPPCSCTSSPTARRAVASRRCSSAPPASWSANPSVG
jgi:hypothetical protein